MTHCTFGTRLTESLVFYCYQNVAFLVVVFHRICTLLFHAMVCLAKKLDTFISQTAGFLSCYLLICADSGAFSLVQGLESDDDDKNPAAGKAEDAK